MRKVLIEKIGETTIVRTWEESSPSKKNNYAYNKGADYSLNHKTNTLNIEDVSKTNPKLSIYFDELDDNLGAANIQEYFDLLAENLFFLAKGSGGGSDGSAGEAIDSTGNTILFDNVIGTFYNEDTPLTGDLTFSEIGAKKGGKAVVYHSEDTEPSIILPATKKIITKKGDYQYNAFGNVYVNRIEALRTPNGNFDLMLQSDYYLPTFDEDVQGVIDLAITNGDTLPSTSALIKVNDTVIALKNEGVWDLCDAVFLFATELREFSKYDIKRKIKATEINPPLIYTSTGFKGQLASTKCLNIGFNPISSGVNYTLNNAGVYIYANGQTGTGYFFGSIDSDNTKRTQLGTNNSNTFYNSLNGNGALFAYGTFTGSHYNLSREDSVNETVIIDGVSNVVANASTGMPNANIYVLARNLAGSVSSSSDVTASALLIGASLKNKDVEIRTIIDNYLA